MAANSVNAADDKLPPPNYWTEIEKEVVGKLKVLGESGILQTLVDNLVINDDPTETTMNALFGVYRAGLVDYSRCEDEMFGEDGEHTELMCKLETVREIFSKDKQLPVHKDYPLRPFQAAKPSLFEDDDKMARTLCEERSGKLAKDCTDDDIKKILPNIKMLQGFVKKYVPDGYNNPLFSHGIGLADPNVREIRSNFLLGDGFFKILEIVVNKDVFAFKCSDRICLMEGIILMFIMNLYILNNTGIKDIDNDGMAILTGYLYQRQSKKIHPDRKDRAAMVKVFVMRHKCLYFTGVLIKEVCGLGITNTLKVIDKLNILGVSPTEKCPIKPKMIAKAVGFIKKGKKNKNVMKINECVAQLKRTMSDEKKL
eukprot:CAMPEP_0194349864 /NCGR_PEP_ID=MMETSP0171-20130528/107324_1 /TAXON_ID=218684 /ORGANISM="Corethron pennatum, Strain L29A3" /LENGTH=368 /DNA_ID=CAMNT_0039117363 /DNA_START=481 /DNA_END=1587 /DNA_ORIENTATION=+